MENWLKSILKREKRKSGKALEVKMIGKNAYLYESTTIWVKGERRRKKVSKYIGKVTPQGVIAGSRKKRDVRSIYEYGNAKFLIEIAQEIIPPLRDAFELDWEEIIAMGIIRCLDSTPLRLMKSRWEKLYLSN